MRVQRPKMKTKCCAHCKRERLAKFIEWHPGIDEWQCSDIDDCDKTINLARLPLGAMGNPEFVCPSCGKQGKRKVAT